jgi:hypothetical protein
VLGEDRAAYGQQVVGRVAVSLSTDFGRGFDKTSLYQMMRFAEVFPNSSVAALRPHLSWAQRFPMDEFTHQYQRRSADVRGK